MSIVDILMVRCAVVGYIRLNSVLAICCGLLAKWLRVRVRVRVTLGQGPGKALAVLFLLLLLFFSGLVSVVNNLSSLVS